MRTLIALLIFGLSTSAHATLIQLDIRGTVRESPIGASSQGAVEANLLLDTVGAVVNIDPRAGASTNFPVCNLFVSSVSSGQILGISIDGLRVFDEIAGASGSASVGVGFRGAPPCPPIRRDGGSLLIQAGGNSLSLAFRKVPARDQISVLDEVRGSTDPTAALLLSGLLTQGDFFSVVTPTGSGLFTVDQLSIRDVTDVPEPPTLLLLLLGFAGLAIGNWKRAPIGPHSP